MTRTICENKAFDWICFNTIIKYWNEKQLWNVNDIVKEWMKSLETTWDRYLTRNFAFFSLSFTIFCSANQATQTGLHLPKVAALILELFSEQLCRRTVVNNGIQSPSKNCATMIGWNSENWNNYVLIYRWWCWWWFFFFFFFNSQIWNIKTTINLSWKF